MSSRLARIRDLLYSDCMSISRSIEDLEQAALQLEPDARLKLMRALVDSLGQLSEKEIDQLWLDEAERRDLELDSARTSAVSGEEVFRRIRALYT